MKIKEHIRQYITIIIVQALALFLLGQLNGLQIQSLSAVTGMTLTYLLVQVIYWYSFVNFFSYLPAWLYPLVTFVLAGGGMMLLGNLVPGIIIADYHTSLQVIMLLTGVSAILAGILSLNIDMQFDKIISRKLVAMHEKPVDTNVPGFLFFEIDGLSTNALREALQAGCMPTLKSWYDQGSHELIQWETDYSAQTGAIQSGILLGSNDNIPAYRWWDRKEKRTIRSGYFPDATALEKRLSSGDGLLANGGTSRTNMFSGDAAESMFTISTILNRERESGPGFYMYLVNPFVIASLLTHFINGIVKEWIQALLQKLRGDRFAVRSRNFFYAFVRAAESELLQSLNTYIVSNDILRGIPAIYTTYAGYDNVSHFTGMESRETRHSLAEIDRYLARLVHIAKHAPRPYHFVILSDHGQSKGGTFKDQHGISLNHFIQNAIGKNKPVVNMPEIDETWDYINALVNDSIHTKSRAASVLRTMVRSKMHDGVVEVGKNRKDLPISKGSLIIYGSGCAGLVYFSESETRMMYEDIQDLYPDLIPSLLSHPGIGFILVRSRGQGDFILGSGGAYFLDQDIIEGNDPLRDFSPNAAELLKRESSFPNCPDLIINAKYDPLEDTICSFENQSSHHGGLGGEQSFPFLFFPTTLPYDNTPIVGAEALHKLLRGWRKTIQQQ